MYAQLRYVGVILTYRKPTSLWGNREISHENLLDMRDDV